METIDISLGTIIFIPLALVGIELLVYGLTQLWYWFIDNEE
jgi:hypothetical protein